MKAFLISFLVCLVTPLAAQTQLSGQSKIHLITFGPGQQALYTSFGHGAIRIQDTIHGFDFVYNYGTFDFDQDNFYLNFALGKPYYSLGLSEYRQAIFVYQYFNQSITEQELNFTHDQKQALFEFLEWNLQEENRNYLYDYFYDNCSNRIPNAFYKVFGDEIYLDTVNYYEGDRSFREMVDVYTPQQPWGDLAIDLCLGLEIDEKMKPSDYMFLPDYLYKAVENGTIRHGDSILPLVKSQIETYKAVPVEYENSTLTPKTVFWLLLVVVTVLTLREIFSRRHFKWVDIVLFGIVWIFGIFLLILWFATEHKSAWNFNLLWANPFHGIFLYFLVKNKKPKLVVYHFLGYSVLLVLMLVFWNLLPQSIHPSLVPLVIALALRGLWIYRATTSRKSWISE